MEKLRKILVVVFALLCVFFAWEAYLQKRDKSAIESLAFFAWKTYQKHGGGDLTLLEAKEWGGQLQSLAGKTNRLIFIEMRPNGEPSSYEPSEKAEKILAYHYICVNLDKNYYPADYGVLKRIAQKDVNFAILSPTAYPLFAATSLTPEGESADWDARILAGVAWGYKQRKAETKNGIDVALTKAGEDRKFSDIRGVFSEKRNTSEIANIRALFVIDGWSESTAAFSENARFAARVAASGSAFAKETAKIANDKLLQQLKRDDLPLGEKLLLARALSEFTMLSDSDSARSEFLDFVLELTTLQREDGFFSNTDTVLLKDNALALSVMSRAFKIFKDKKFKDSMDASIAALQKKTENRPILPAVLQDANSKNPKSEAAALDYVLLARAYLDAYFADNKPKYLELSKKSFAHLDEIFKDSVNDGWFENSKKSIFAPFHYRVLNDSNYPSTMGEALQILADTSSLNDNISRRLITIISAYKFNVMPENFVDRASVKLAMLANPMRASAPSMTLNAMNN